MEQSSTPAASPPPPSESPRKARRLGESYGGLPSTITIGGRSIPLTTILIGVGALVVLAILILPPVQLPARIAWLGCTQVSQQSPSVDGPDGLNVSLVDPDGPSLRLKMSHVTQDKLPAAAIKVMPAEWTPISSMYQLGACGNSKIPVTLNVPAEVDAATADTIDLVSWNGKSWQWVGGQADVPNSMVVAQLDSAPPNVMAVQTAPTSPVLGAELPIGAPVSDRAALLVNEYAATAFIIAHDGTLQGDPAEMPEPVEGAQATWIVTRNWAPEGAVNAGMVEEILADGKLRAAHAKAVTEAATSANYSGVMIDYRGLAEDSRAGFTRLVTELAASLHKSKKSLGVVVPAAVQMGDEWDTGGYDWRAIGAVADVVQVYVPNDPTVSPRRIQTMLRWGVSQVNRAKLQMAITASSARQTGNMVQVISYEEALKPFKAIAAPDGSTEVSPGAQVKLTLGDQSGVEFDEALRMYRYTLTASDNTTSTIWLNTGASLAQKLDLALGFNLRGVMVQGLLTSAQEPGIWSALEQYQVEALATAPSRLQVVWTVRSADGTQLPGGASTLTDTAYLWTAPTNPGQYTIAAALPGSATRGELAINVVQPTPTPAPQPTPVPVPGVEGKCPDAKFVSDVTVPDNTQFDKNKEFTKTWRIRNSGSCDWPAGTLAAYASGEKMSAPDTVQIGAVKMGETADITVKLKSPDKDGNFAATWRLMDDKGELFGEMMTVVIVAGQPQPASAAAPGAAAPPPIPAGTAGGLELGGQVHGFGHPDKMHYAGMNWVKHQVRWGPGDQPGPVAGVIADTHAKGFKVLLSVLGGPGDAKPANFPAYAAFVGGLAALGPDAIEIWNEENIDREWQNGAINPATYTELLKQSYVAIKNANRNVMVISGAPAPTGFFGGCSGGGCDDAPFVAGMAAAGAAAYMDCIGAHYNEGIVGPDQTNGDPRSEHYTRYFWGMVNTYYNAFGGARKVCFTEFGYLTPEGYGGLPSWFAWARNTTVAQQAQWLARAASLSAASGKVRLIIIFNVDFTYYGDDPQAGYAIIRPGGGCPACETLHQVLGTR